MNDVEHMNKRRRRVKRLKNMIVGAFFLVITMPIAMCIYMGCTLHGIRNDLAEMTAQYDSQLVITDDLQNLLNGERESKQEAERQLKDIVDRLEAKDEELDLSAINIAEEEEVKRVYLTFDDGPSIYTEEILDILDEYGVKATFFVTGEAADEHPDRYKMIVDRGHTLGLHSYSHRYGEVYRSKDSFIKDYNRIRSFVEETTGITPVIYRFPGGSSNTVSHTDMDELCDFLGEQGVKYYDWNVSSGDATSQALSAERIVANCMAGVANHQDSIILMHDTSTKHSTVVALPIILEQILSMDNTEILPITSDTEEVHHRDSKEKQ